MNETTSLSPPRRVRYQPIPGSWQRREHPNWSESVFRIPEDRPHGTIYYVTKGKFIKRGSTALVEQLPSGYVIKTPTPNPYCPAEEEDHRHGMRTEVEVYRRIGSCPYIPRLIDWDPESCCLTLEYLENGDLETYMTETIYIPAGDRQKWTLQAAKALQAVHAAEFVHGDVTPRNFMLDRNLDLHLGDFAGSSMAGSIPSVAAGSRFQPPGWSWNRGVEKTDDIFALGSVLYFIMVGKEPYAHLGEENVEQMYREGGFPDVSYLRCGTTIRGCWNETMSTTEQVINSLTASYF